MKDSDYSCAGNQHLFRAGETACCCGKKSAIADFDKHKREHPEFYPPSSPAPPQEDERFPRIPPITTYEYRLYSEAFVAAKDAEIADAADEIARLKALYGDIDKQSARYAELLDKAEAERDARPTTWAYEQACAAIEKHRARAERLAAALTEASAALRRMWCYVPKWEPDDYKRPELFAKIDAALAEEKE